MLRRIGELGRQRGFSVRRGYGVGASLRPLLLPRQLADDAGPTSVPSTDGAVATTRRMKARNNRRLRRGSEGRAGREAASVDQAYFSLLQELSRASVEAPQLVLLDDLEPNDSEGLRGARLLCHLAQDLPVVVVAAVRADARSWEDRVGGRGLRELRRDGTARWIDLRPLSRQESERLAGLALEAESGRPAALGQVREVVRASGGSPYLVLEVARAWAASPQGRRPRGARRRGERGVDSAVTAAGSVPAAARAAVADRLATLGREDLRLLGVAAHLGGAFTPDAVGAAVGRPGAVVVRRLAVLAADGWPITDERTTPPSFSFVHQLLEDTVRSLPDATPRRPELRRLARWWSTHRPDDPVTGSRLLRHSGDAISGLHAAERGVDTLLAQAAMRGIADLVRGAQADERTLTDRRYTARLGLYAAERLRETGDFYWVRELLSDLPTDALDAAQRWRADFLRVESGLSRDLPASEALLAALRARCADASFRKAPAKAESLGFLASLRDVVSGSIHSDGALARLEHAAISLERVGLRFESCRLHTAEVDLFSGSAQWDLAHRACAEALRILPRQGREAAFLSWTVRDAESRLLFREGEVERALSMAKEQVELLLDRGDVGRAARSFWQLGAFEYGLRRTEEARTHLGRATELFSAFGSPEFVAAAHTLRGWTWIVDADWTRAWEAFNDAIHAVASESWASERWGARVGLALLAAESGDAAGARAALAAVEGKELPSRSYGTEYACTRARVLELTGELAPARTALVTALEQTRAPMTDVLELYQQLARWDDLHGAPGIAEEWRDRIRGLPPSVLRAVPSPWRGLGSYARSALPTPTSPNASVEATSFRVGPVRARIVALLQAAGRPSGSPAAFGLSEVEIARSLATSRDSLSRALRRLEEEGAIQRSSGRPRGARRRVFLYRLSSRPTG